MLCDFYRIFDEVVSKWRSIVNVEDFRYNQGHVEMKFPDSKLSRHANRVYTIGAYKLFENQFLKFLEYCQGLVVCNDGEHRWTKDIALSQGSSGVGDAEKVNKKDIVGSSVWRREMLRKFPDLISASELNVNTREIHRRRI
ncbi:hypothetical protein M9H77_13729 [Catharanthus roseus]|uniref:Uncharacterized protein n=1 Tax=Catharanthus roseus TaxID=4058 RepID=A0ACC0BL55_CATRO|nr:hypothetical protein M9H77_13729 [Catharanthus roseus]